MMFSLKAYGRAAIRHTSKFCVKLHKEKSFRKGKTLKHSTLSFSGQAHFLSRTLHNGRPKPVETFSLKKKVFRDDLPGIIYQDEAVVVMSKPPGLCTARGISNQQSLSHFAFDTVGNESNNIDKMIVHRLDMETSGVVVMARTNQALRNLHRQFRERKTEKVYESLVAGWVEISHGAIDFPLGRDFEHPPWMRSVTQDYMDRLNLALKKQNIEGSDYWLKLLKKQPKPSLTDYQVIQKDHISHQDKQLEATRLKLIPRTGRSHQLRVHCASIGHPIIGDRLYGINGKAAKYGGVGKVSERLTKVQVELEEYVKGKNINLCLHAKELILNHPITGDRIKFEASAPF